MQLRPRKRLEQWDFHTGRQAALTFRPACVQRPESVTQTLMSFIKPLKCGAGNHCFLGCHLMTIGMLPRPGVGAWCCESAVGGEKRAHFFENLFGSLVEEPVSGVECDAGGLWCGAAY